MVIINKRVVDEAVAASKYNGSVTMLKDYFIGSFSSSKQSRMSAFIIIIIGVPSELTCSKYLLNIILPIVM
jgi:hypothetical protein